VSATTFATTSDAILSAITLAAAALSAITLSAAALIAASHAASHTGTGGGGGGEEVVIAVDADDATEVNVPLLAVTVKVYVVDAASPEIAIGDVLPVAVAPPGDAVTV
jgi:hypothetical protein